jgi:segregation and condensation protein B
MTETLSPESRLIEALIFAAAEPVSVSEIEKRVPDGTDIVSILNQLQTDYESRGFELVKRGSGWCFRTSPDLVDHLNLEKEIPKKLSRAAMETLAVVAYHQPITRPEIENIRGVSISKGTLDFLMEAGWIKIGRKLDVPGRPVTWKTTAQFLDDFGLETLKDLPGLDELKASGLLDSRASIDIIAKEEMDLFDNVDEEDNNDAVNYMKDNEEE